MSFSPTIPEEPRAPEPEYILLVHPGKSRPPALQEEGRGPNGRCGAHDDQFHAYGLLAWQIRLMRDFRHAQEENLRHFRGFNDPNTIDIVAEPPGEDE